MKVYMDSTYEDGHLLELFPDEGPDGKTIEDVEHRLHGMDLHEFLCDWNYGEDLQVVVEVDGERLGFDVRLGQLNSQGLQP